LHEIEIHWPGWSEVRYPTLYGLKPDIAAGPKSANTGSRTFKNAKEKPPEGGFPFNPDY
jgi:hypothetical protein